MNGGQPIARITVVNDTPEFLEMVRDVLEEAQLDTTTVEGDREDALERICASRPDLLMIDLRLSADTLLGWDVAQQVRAMPQFRELPVLVCSGDVLALKALAEDLEGDRAVATLPKPFGIDELTAALDGLLAEARGS